ncbi:MAG: hypothetical protein JXR37_04330 [Kiritimatiellae bacterium]|nr:hypothetical protein [Kiritimatiellia bacterium]
MRRIRLRPYHPTYVVAYYGDGVPAGGRARAGFEAVQRRIRETPLDEIEIEIVREHDDVCAGCIFRRESAGGSLWGQRHTCTSAEDPKIIAEVERVNEKMFRLLGLGYGSVIGLRELVSLLREKLPVIDDDMLGGRPMQESYEKGLAALATRRD